MCQAKGLAGANALKRAGMKVIPTTNEKPGVYKCKVNGAKATESEVEWQQVSGSPGLRGQESPEDFIPRSTGN